MSSSNSLGFSCVLVHHRMAAWNDKNVQTFEPEQIMGSGAMRSVLLHGNFLAIFMNHAESQQLFQQSCRFAGGYFLVDLGSCCFFACSSSWTRQLLRHGRALSCLAALLASWGFFLSLGAFGALNHLDVGRK